MKEVFFFLNGIVRKHGINRFNVVLENNIEIVVSLSGNMKKYAIRILTEDRVKIRFNIKSPLETGVIVERLKYLR